MFGYDSKKLIQRIFLEIGHRELKIEQIRQALASCMDFEPYTVFKRIDQHNTGTIGALSLLNLMVLNGYRHLCLQDFFQMLQYFNISQRKDNSIDFEEFLQFVLPCNNKVLRCKVTQRRPIRSNNEILQYDQKNSLSRIVESRLSQLIYEEIQLHSEKQRLIQILLKTHDFNMKAAFKAVDDWTYGYIDCSNLKRFLIGMGYTKQKGDGHNMQHLLQGIIRRIDLNGDGKADYDEFKYMLKPDEVTPVTTGSVRNIMLNEQKKMKKKRAKTAKKRPASAYKQAFSNQEYNMFNQPDSTTTTFNRELSGGGKTFDQKLTNTSFAPNYVQNTFEVQPNRALEEIKRQRQVRQQMQEMPLGQILNIQRQQVLEKSNSSLDQRPEILAGGEDEYSEEQDVDEPTQIDIQIQQTNNYKRQMPLQGNRNEAPSAAQILNLKQNSGKGLRKSNYPRKNFKNKLIEHKIFEENPRPTQFGKGVLTTNYQEFSKLLIDYIYQERRLEAQKCELIKKADFNLMDCFKIFDWRCSGKISAQDILRSLQEYFGYTSEPVRWQNQIQLLFRRYDLDMDQQLDFSEFSYLFLPTNPDFASILAARPDFYMNRQEYELANYFNHDTKQEILNFWTLQFNSEIEQEILRNQISSNNYLQLKELFTHIDYDLDGFIHIQDLNQFLQTNGVFKPTEIDLQALFRKIDVTKKGRANFSDFQNEFDRKLK